MFPKFHVLLGLIFSIIVFLIFPFIGLLGLTIIFLSSFLIDFDHYLYYFFNKKSLNLKKSYLWFKEKGEKFSKLPKKEMKNYSLIVSYFHGLEWVILFFILGHFFQNFFYFVGIGMLFHLVLDWIYSYLTLGRFFKISVIFDYFHNKNLKKF